MENKSSLNPLGKIVLSRTNLLILIFLFIGCQQFPLISIGGNFKTYELFALILLFKFRTRLYLNTIMLAFFILFIVSPLISFIVSFGIDIPASFYERYPEAIGTIKFGGRFYSFLQLIFSFFCFSVVSSIYSDKTLLLSMDKWMGKVIIVATFISVYSLISMCTVDVIAIYFPKFIQNLSVYHFRSHGFYMEPGYYVPYQTWMCLFAFYFRNSLRHGKLMFYLNATSLVCTFSSALAPLCLLLLFSPFIFQHKFTTRIRAALLIALFSVVILTVLKVTGFYDFIYYVLVDKISNFFSATDHTLDSGAFRSLTSRIGLEIFKSYPITGVGVGNSVFYMHLFENKMGIINWGETLTLGVLPLSLYSSLLAEQGFLGGICLLIVICCSMYKFWRHRNRGKYGKLFFIGSAVNFAAMLSIPVVYSLYMWVFIALGLGYCKLLDRGDVL